MCFKRIRPVAIFAVPAALLIVTVAFRPLIDPKAAAASNTVMATFVGQGPGPINDPDNGPVTGAIKSVVPHPTNADIVWVGSVGGGVWKTTNATSTSPSWTPLTDHMPSLSIGALALDPTYSSNDVLVAGAGLWSAYARFFNERVGGPLTGIIRTTDGGATWIALGATDLGGEDLSGVAPRGPVIVATSKGGLGGVWRSTNTGATFQRLSGQSSSGLPVGRAYDLKGDPSNPHRLYAGISGPGGGVYRSENDGATWQALGGANFYGHASGDIATNADNMKIAVHSNPGPNTNVVYVVVDVGDEAVGVFRSEDHGDHWIPFDMPTSVFNSTVYGLHPGKQGGTHLSMVADPIHSNLVYLGGDKEPEREGGGRLFRCDTSKPGGLGLQCEIMTREDTINDSTTHGDSRDMAFDALGNILEADDGGIFRRFLPRTSGGIWNPINGNLSLVEAHSCGYDHVARVVICGTQDNGTAQQPSPGAQAWDQVGAFDGARVTVADQSNPSRRYYSAHNLDFFTRATCDQNNNCVIRQPDLFVPAAGQKLSEVETLPFYPPIAANPTDGMRLVIVAGAIYESLDGGETLTALSGFTGTSAHALAYGTSGNPEVIYAGSEDGVFLRPGSGNSVSKLSNYPGDIPLGISLDPDNWRSAWVIDKNHAWYTTNAGADWKPFTGNLAASDLHAIKFIPGADASIIAVGAADGVYITNTSQLGHWLKLSGQLPNAVAYGLDYDQHDDVLLISTMGRGAWTMLSASHVNLPPIVNAGPDGTANEGAPFTSSGSFTDPNSPAGETYSAAVDYGDGGGSQTLTLRPDGTFDLSRVYADNGSYTVSVSVTDGQGLSDVDTTKVTVANVPPTVGPISIIATPAPVGTNLSLSGVFSDPGIFDTHTGTIRWGDGTGPAPAILGGSNTTGTISGTHTTSLLGLFTVRTTVVDKDGGTGFTTSQCHTPITIDATSASGVPVNFPLPNTANPPASCLPPSGSMFPIGTTNVSCTETDAAQHVNTCLFSVTVRTPLEVKQDVLGQLIAFRAAVTDQQDGRKLDEAIKQLQMSIDPSKWINSTHPNEEDSEKVFNEEKDTVHKLFDLIKDKHSAISDTILQGFIDRITSADRVLALIAINDAVGRGGDPKKLDAANQELAKGDAAQSMGRPYEAIDHYKNCWKQALQS